MEIHWYCPCGTTRQVMAEAIADRIAPSYVCHECEHLVGPVYESEELIRHEVEEDGC